MAQTGNSMTSATQVLPIQCNVLSSDRPYQLSEALTAADDITISFFDHTVPEFMEPELERLYQSVYSTAARLKIYEQDRDLSSYVARRGGQVISAILFRLENSKVVVLNQQTTVESIEIARFSSAAFSRYRGVSDISFWGLMPSEPGGIPYPTRRSYCLPEVVVALPESADAYLSSLGKSTRRSIRSSLKKAKATFPSFSVEAKVTGDISADAIFDIINLNNARMVVKEKVTYNSDEETRRLVRLASVYGLVLTLKIDGLTCAGAIGYRVGSTCFFHTLAHDPRFDEFKLGTVCCYLMMSECISRGVTSVRFGGSSHRYKFDFKGELLHLDHLTIYRHLGHYIVQAPRAVAASFVAFLEKAKLWILLADRRDDFASRAIARGMTRMRAFRRLDIAPSVEE
jgi:hypothetical protein